MVQRPNPKLEDPDISSCLHRVISLTQSMIALADAGEALENVESRRVFLTLRDCGYKLRRLATDQLGRREAERTGDAPLSSESSVLADETPADIAARPAVALGESLGKRVLLVDDDPDVLRYLEAWFRDRGFDTTAASGGHEALERASTSRPDLVTLDISMPEGSGAEAYQALKTVSELRHVPVIVITAVTDARKDFRCDLDALPPPEGFFAKPIDLSELGRLVKKLIEPGGSSRLQPAGN